MGVVLYFCYGWNSENSTLGMRQYNMSIWNLLGLKIAFLLSKFEHKLCHILSFMNVCYGKY